MMAGKRIKRAEQASRMRMPCYRTRRNVVVVCLLAVGILMVFGTVDRQIFQKDFLQREGARRYLRVVNVPADRGVIMDRNGETLAVSTPVDSVGADPRELSSDVRVLSPLAKALRIKVADLQQHLAQYSDRALIYLKRRLTPDTAKKIRDLKIPGIHLDREYRRFYPAGEVAAHVVGFTNVEDRGQEGLELAFDKTLAGRSGKKRVIRDGRRQIIRDVESIRTPRPGRDLVLSLDLRLQFLAYRELKRAVEKHKAKGGTALLLDVRSGEVLAMVNQPSYNPNGDRYRDMVAGKVRNRAVTDPFEPGSTMKPFIVAAALESGKYTPKTKVNTSPGYYKIGKEMVKDERNYGLMDVSGIIKKSSNVGVSKISLNLVAKELWRFLDKVGFGVPMESGFPGEAAGRLTAYYRWQKFDRATISFGYGVMANAMQLARAYAAIAADGYMPDITFTKQDSKTNAQQVMSETTAGQVRDMLETVVSADGTAPRAAVPGYRVGGKTGTVKKTVNGVYADNHYLAVFAGMAPMSNPRFAMVVMIDEPSKGGFYGGRVAAPVFAKVMAGTLRLMNVAPDQPMMRDVRMVSVGGKG